MVFLQFYGRCWTMLPFICSDEHFCAICRFLRAWSKQLYFGIHLNWMGVWAGLNLVGHYAKMSTPPWSTLVEKTFYAVRVTVDTLNAQMADMKCHIEGAETSRESISPRLSNYCKWQRTERKCPRRVFRLVQWLIIDRFRVLRGFVGLNFWRYPHLWVKQRITTRFWVFGISLHGISYKIRITYK